MGKIILLTLSMAMMSVSNAAYFLPDLTNVGNLDTFLLEDAQQGSPDSEALWVQAALGDPTVDWTISQADVTYQETTTAGIWAFSILDDPEYFIVKNSNRVALFDNNVDLAFGVFDASLLSAGMNIPTDPWIISHVTSLNASGGGGGGGTGNNVPEPGLILMVFMGLACVGLIQWHSSASRKHRG